MQHQLSTSNSNLLLQMSRPFIKFSCNGKWNTVLNHLYRPNIKNSRFLIRGVRFLFFSFRSDQREGGFPGHRLEEKIYFPYIFYISKNNKKVNAAAILKCGCWWETLFLLLFVLKDTWTKIIAGGALTPNLSAFAYILQPW